MYKLLLIFLIFSTDLVFGQDRMEVPAIKPREQIVSHKFYTLSYIEGYELASWVAYELTSEEASATMDYKVKYHEDPMISTGSATLKDYKKSGFILAQLAPVEDMMFSEEAVEESFYLSNIVPQKPAFSKYTWKKLNDLVRSWAKASGSLYIVSGPVLADAPFPTFGPDKVSIPSRFFKVVLDMKNQKGMGFVLKNNITTGSLKSYAMSIDMVEQITGIDFFPSLPDDQEKNIESKFDTSAWNFELPE